jgi:hypothetical protein
LYAVSCIKVEVVFSEVIEVTSTFSSSRYCAFGRRGKSGWQDRQPQPDLLFDWNWSSVMLGTPGPDHLLIPDSVSSDQFLNNIREDEKMLVPSTFVDVCIILVKTASVLIALASTVKW